jgi:hypothetical protein
VLKHRLAASAVFALSIGGLVPAAAHADSPSGSTFYVNGAPGADCTNAGTGLKTAPFCTIQAAVNVAAAGDTVSVAPAEYTAGATISTTGTATAPISIVTGAAGGYDGDAMIQFNANTVGFTVDNAQYVSITDFLMQSGTSPVNGSILVENSSHVTLDGLGVNGQSAAISVVESPDVTVERTQVSDDNISSGIWLGGGTGDVITSDYVHTSGTGNGIVDVSSSDADITSNTVTGGCVGMSIAPGSDGEPTNVVIDNNIVANLSANSICGGGDGIEVGDSPNATDNYNIVYPGTANGVAYNWNAVDYTTAAAFNTGTGQGSADLTVNPELGYSPQLASNSPAINSANSDAPGELATDFYGNLRGNDPFVPDTGVGTYDYYDRGAVQYQDPLTNFGPPAVSPQGALGFTFTPTEPAGSWGAATYSFNFGDGTAPQTTSGTISHEYSVPGDYTTTVTATDPAGTTASSSVNLITSGSDFTPIAPVRIVDTRSGTGVSEGQLQPGSEPTVTADGIEGIPSDATAIAVNLTVTNTHGSGFLEAFAPMDPCTGCAPSVSNLNYGAGQTVANEAVIPLEGGQFRLLNGGTLAGPIDVIADVTGYFTRSAASGYTPLTPDRLLDTRSGIGAPTAQVAPGGSVDLTIAGADSGALPTSGITAVALHLTTTDTSGTGLITASPDGTASSTSNLNYTPKSTVANTVIVQVGPDGKVQLTNSGTLASPVDLIADVTGYYSTSSTGAYVPVTPTRLLDTRNSAPLGKTGTVTVNPSAIDTDIPADALAYAFNTTVTGPVGTGFITAYPTGTAVPNVSTVNYTPGQTIANLAQSSAGNGGQVTFANEGTEASTVQLIVDVFGYYSSN